MNQEDLNRHYEIRNEEAEEALRKIGELLKEHVPPNMGFSLLMFSYGEGGSMFYISSAKREDMVKAMQEFIRKQS